MNNIETELPRWIDDRESVVAKILSLGFIHQKTITQTEKIYDTSDAGLFKNHEKIRIRHDGDSIVLAYKGKPKSNAAFITRSEVEITLTPEQAPNMEAFLACVGYPYCFQIVKKRDVFTLDDIEVSIDEYPILGTHFEMEGGEEKIMELAREIWSDASDFPRIRLSDRFKSIIEKTGKSAVELIQDYKTETGIDLGHLELILD